MVSGSSADSGEDDTGGGVGEEKHVVRSFVCRQQQEQYTTIAHICQSINSRMLTMPTLVGRGVRAEN